MKLISQCTRGSVVAVMMISGLALLGMAMGFTGNGTTDSEQLIAREKAWAKAAIDGDADRMASFMADDYVELAWEPASQTSPAHWTAAGKSAWVDDVRRRSEVYTSVDVRNLTVQLQGTLAVVTGEYSQTGTHNGNDISATGIYANTWTKRNGRWVVLHSVFP